LQKTPTLGASHSENVDAKLSFLPERLRKKLLPFQEKGIIYALQRSGRCMIADEMGLGKTIQAIAISYYYKNEWPLLIVVPSSLRYPWVDEMEKWIPELSPDDISIIQNKTDIGGISTSKVTILGYGLLTSDAQTLVDTLYRQNFKVVVIDESHYMKSRNGSKILLPIVQKALRAVLLTGTPALGRPEELFMQIEALYPRRFGTWSEYAKKYCNARVRFFGKRARWDCRGASNLEELHQLLSEIMIRRLKNDVLTQLPPKVRQRIPFDLPQAAAKNLNATFAEWEKLMRNLNSDATESHFSQVMSLVTRMYKETAIAKAGAVKDYIKMMLENDKLKFLVFAHHLSMLQACTEAVIENKVRYIRIDGSVPSAERIHLVNQFQKDPETRVAILSIQAAGQGLTFTAATHVVFAELYWDPGHIKQAEDRAHRIGQCSSVNIHFLIAKGTMDTLMWAMLAKVTGSTLNGKKEKMQAEEGDKEKWDFLSFAETWTPNESLEDPQNELLFTHFEKDKQHDIRSFFSPKSSAEKKRKRLSGNESLHNDSESSEATAEEDAEKRNENLDSTRMSDVATICQESTCEHEAKRARSISGSTPVSSSHEQKTSVTGKELSLVPEQNSEVHPCGLNASSKSTASNKVWHCSVCTYTNNDLLPYCEMCSSPQSSKVERNGETPTSQTEEDVSKDSRRNGERAECSAEDRREDLREVVTQQSVEISKQETIGIEKEESEQKCGEDVGKSDTFQIYDGLLFCASRNTDRIHLYTKDGEPLNHNFIPLDIQLDNWEDLPEAFQHKKNRAVILRFVKEWTQLTAMKQRIVRKSGQIFCSPVHAAEELSRKQSVGSSTKRYVTKEDVAAASLAKANSSGGSTRLISRQSRACLRNENASAEQSTNLLPETGPSVLQAEQTEAGGSSLSKGYLQALDSQGNPLCLSCQQPTAQLEPGCQARAWDTRFCSHSCQEDFSIRSSQSYLRTKVLQIEHGVCQSCKQNAQELYLSVRDAPRSQRKQLLESSWMSQLPLGQLNEMITNPTEGQFWQVDHIRPVYSGGGQCSLENLQTLCTLCHRERTAKQAKERSQLKRRSLGTKYGCDITKFFVK
ncbi:DNA annealing helicase and endonuclease ZRANB3, partial [Acanthisitta chloris]